MIEKEINSQKKRIKQKIIGSEKGKYQWKNKYTQSDSRKKNVFFS